MGAFGLGAWNSLSAEDPEPSLMDELTGLAYDPELEQVRHRAQDRIAQSNLRNALVTAKAHFTERGTYKGFDPDTASEIEPSLPWEGDRPAAARVVSINLAERSLIVLSTLSDSGRAFCIGEEAGVVAYGTKDARGARSVRDCGRNPEWNGP